MWFSISHGMLLFAQVLRHPISKEKSFSVTTKTNLSSSDRHFSRFLVQKAFLLAALLYSSLLLGMAGCTHADKPQYAAQALSQLAAVKQQFFITSDSVQLFVRTSGTGAPCLFVHGGPGAWSASFEQLGGDVVEDCLRMTYYDQRGCGRSASATNRDYSLLRMVEDIEEIRKQLGLEKLYLLSHSFGGILAVNYAKKYPEHVLGLVLLNSTLNMTQSLEQNIQQSRVFLHMPPLPLQPQKDVLLSSLVSVIADLEKQKIRYKMLAESPRTTMLLDSIDRTIPNGQHAFGQAVWKYPEYFTDYKGLTAQIKAPVLIIAGKKDYAVGPTHHLGFRFPQAQIKEIDGSHMLYYEKNPEYHAVVQAFIRQQVPLQ